MTNMVTILSPCMFHFKHTVILPIDESASVWRTCKFGKRSESTVLVHEAASAYLAY